MKTIPEPLLDWLDCAMSVVKSEDTSRPLVTLSYAQSLDGSIATKQGEVLTLSSKASFYMTHYLRSIHDAILVGIGTVLADNPQLTVREVEGDNPRPVVLDSDLRTPSDTRLFAQPPFPWIFTANTDEDKIAVQEAQGAEVFLVDQDEAGLLRLDDVLLGLGAHDIRSLMIEGGAQVIQNFLAQGLADQLVLTISPSFVGGYKAVDTLIESEFPQVQNPQITLLENDIIVWGALR